MTLSFTIFKSEAAEILSEMHVRSFREGGQVWSAADIRSIMQSPGSEALVVSLDQNPAGFLLWRGVGQEAEILTIAVVPPFRGREVGLYLVRQLFDRALQAGVRQIFLEVNAHNKAALALYDRAGFAEVGRRRGYYDTGNGLKQDALIMKYCLK